MVPISNQKCHLSTFRKLARVLALDLKHPEFKKLYEGLRLLKAPAEETAGKKRTCRALRPQQVWKILEVRDGDTALEARNKALLSVTIPHRNASRRSDCPQVVGYRLRYRYYPVQHGKDDKYRW